MTEPTTIPVPVIVAGVGLTIQTRHPSLLQPRRGSRHDAIDRTDPLLTSGLKFDTTDEPVRFSSRSFPCVIATVVNPMRRYTRGNEDHRMRPLILLAVLIGLAAPGGASAQDVHIPVTVVSGLSEGEQGVLSGARFAEHVVRASNAIVTEEPLTVGRRTIPAGTPLAQVRSTFLPVQRVWCDVRSMGRWSSGDAACFQDRDGDGRLDRSLRGLTQPGYFTFGVATIGDSRDLALQATYREATPEERPTTRFGLILSRNFTGQHGFAITVPLNDNDWLVNPAPCPITPDRSDGRQVIRFQGLGLEVSEPRDGGSWTVISTIPRDADIVLSFRRR